LTQLPEEAKELDKELRAITKEKNEAVRGQDFEKVFLLPTHVQSLLMKLVMCLLDIAFCLHLTGLHVLGLECTGWRITGS
jgi:hypothetical protein